MFLLIIKTSPKNVGPEVDMSSRVLKTATLPRLPKHIMEGGFPKF